MYRYELIQLLCLLLTFECIRAKNCNKIRIFWALHFLWRMFLYNRPYKNVTRRHIFVLFIKIFVVADPDANPVLLKA